MIRPNFPTLFLAAVLAVPALVACDPFSPELSPTPFLCGDDGECPDGYSCNDDNICSKGDDETPIDASVTFQCADDSSLEPNDTPNQAFITPIPNARPDYALVSMAICPSDDRDHYKFSVSQANTYVEATVIGLADRAPLILNVLNSNGTKIGDGGPVTGMTQVVKLAPLQVGVGAYVVQIYAADQVENNYEIQIKTCQDPPCE